jgi:hypothetical protein
MPTNLSKYEVAEGGKIGELDDIKIAFNLK